MVCIQLGACPQTVFQSLGLEGKPLPAAACSIETKTCYNSNMQQYHGSQQDFYLAIIKKRFRKTCLFASQICRVLKSSLARLYKHFTLHLMNAGAVFKFNQSGTNILFMNKEQWLTL